MTKYYIFLIFILFLSPTHVYGSTYRLQSDITYSQINQATLQLDICSPTDNTIPIPTLVYFHGGGFQSGDKSQIHFLCEPLTSRGYNLVSVNYRLLPDYSYPAPLDDGQLAIRWLRANAIQYHIDPNQIIAMGSSAGASLAAVIGTTPSTRNPQASLSQYSSKPQGTIVLAGVYNFKKSLLGTWNPLESFFHNNAQAMSDFSAINLASPDDGPFLLLHGKFDKTNLTVQSLSMHKKLDQIAVPNRFLTFITTHGVAGYKKAIAQKAIFTYLETYFPSSIPISLSDLPGDLTDDSHVNLADYNLLVSGYGTTYNLSHYNLLVANYK